MWTRVNLNSSFTKKTIKGISSKMAENNFLQMVEGEHNPAIIMSTQMIIWKVNNYLEGVRRISFVRSPE